MSSPVNNLAFLKNKQIYDFINIVHRRDYLEGLTLIRIFLNKIQLQNGIQTEITIREQQRLKQYFKSLPIGVVAERGLRLISDFNENITKDEDQKQMFTANSVWLSPSISQRKPENTYKRYVIIHCNINTIYYYNKIFKSNLFSFILFRISINIFKIMLYNNIVANK